MNEKDYVWPSGDTCSNYKYTKNFQPIAYFKVVMYSCGLFCSYPCSQNTR